ncbi:MAG: serine hydrolase [Chitinophagaceae bacterium]|nr:serine hydrolase [Chitinophagaceae bacterium]
MKKLSSVLLLLLYVISAFTQSLPRSIPEAEGVSSAAIIRFIDAYQTKKHELHSVMIIRHGKVIAEGWWSPYRADLKHSMYSVSKSWTSTAIGFAVDEKKLSVDDKVISFFPEYASLSSKPYLADLKVKDLLTMSVGHAKEMFERVFMQADWAKGFLEIPIVNVPGTKFLYNTLATYMLSAIVQKVTGQTVMDYLQPRLFTPLGISGIDWEMNYKGINTGGWGIRVKTEDMAKLGLLYLNQGKFNGKQILSADWVKEATGKQIEQNPSATQEKKDSSDWLQGYGYQFWRCRNNAFRADGAFGQYIVMMPELDAVVVITSESLDLQDDLNMIWKYLLPAFNTTALNPDPKSLRQLKKKTNRLKLDPPVSHLRKGDEHLLNTTFALTANAFDFRNLTIQKKKKNWSLQIETKDKKTHLIPLGFETWSFGETKLVGPYLLRPAPVNFGLLYPFKVAGSCRWLDGQTLEVTVRYIESPHHWTMTMKLEEGQLKLKMINSYNPETVIEITGKQ